MSLERLQGRQRRGKDSQWEEEKVCALMEAFGLGGLGASCVIGQGLKESVDIFERSKVKYLKRGRVKIEPKSESFKAHLSLHQWDTTS